MKRKLENNLAMGENGSPTLTKDNDWFGTYNKAVLIKGFLEEYSESFEHNNMCALYGEWGSGKSTVMRFLEDNVSGYKTIYFEAWQLEGNSDLRISLLECMVEEMTKTIGEVESIDWSEEIKELKIFFFEFVKNINFNLGTISFDAKDAFDEVKSNRICDKKSSYSLLVQFKEKFKRVEEIYCKALNVSGIIVFIDDLDRCKPESVLELMAGIKLFFTYGQRTLYFMGVDKKAITDIILLRYNNHIKANDYLEKIFDVNFTMAKPDHVKGNLFIAEMFPEDVFVDSLEHKEFVEFLASFFDAIRFKNPRRVKKLMNKYTLLEYFLTTNFHNTEIKSIVKQLPTVNSTSRTLNPITTMFLLYLLIMKEFYYAHFIELLEYKKRIVSYSKYFRARESTYTYDEIESYCVISRFADRGIRSRDFSLSILPDKGKGSKFLGHGLMLLFAPFISETANVTFDYSTKINDAKATMNEFVSKFYKNHNDIRYLFSRFLISDLMFVGSIDAGRGLMIQNKSKYTDLLFDNNVEVENMINIIQVAEFIDKYI